MTTLSNKPDAVDFMQSQYAFAAHIRDPQQHPCPQDIEDRRMNIYRELFYNNVEGFMASSFPVLRKIMDDEQWHALIRDYFSNHKAKTPLFPEMPREFLQYLQEEREPQDNDPAFLLELAHYEWVELALSLADEENSSKDINSDGDLLQEHPVLSSLAWPLQYRYPVHQIGPDYQPEKPLDVPTFIVVYRNTDDNVGFLEINPVTAHLLQLLSGDNNQSGRALLEQIAIEINHADHETVIQGGLSILQDLRARNIILGTQTSTA
ncbi:MAG: putative DNA-binding domain-containing protein [Gammaproteobacteria bacterium]|nr:putative DNA-binding domain-containing protein [Gammaproteobacteria bacterium]